MSVEDLILCFRQPAVFVAWAEHERQEKEEADRAFRRRRLEAAGYMDAGELAAQAEEAAKRHRDAAQAMAHTWELLHRKLYAIDPWLALRLPLVELENTKGFADVADAVRCVGEELAKRVQEDGAKKQEPQTIPEWVSQLPKELSAADLATALGLPPEATRKKLERLAERYPDCYIPNDSPRRGDARRLYRVRDVLPELLRERR